MTAETRLFNCYKFSSTLNLKKPRKKLSIF